MNDQAKGFIDLPGDDDIDQSLYMSGASTATSMDNSSLPIKPDIHPYLEIGKCLQNLRRSVFDMYHEEIQKSPPHFQADRLTQSQPSSSERNSSSDARHQHDILMTPGIETTDVSHDGYTGSLNMSEGITKHRHSVSFKADDLMHGDIMSERVELDDETSWRRSSTAAMVTHSITTIVNQHEEKFVSLSKEIDYWKSQADSLAQRLQENDDTYSSKIESVLVEQQYLAEQQQQVLRELNAAIAAHHAATAATSIQQQLQPGESKTMGSPPSSGALMTPELAKGVGNDLWRKSVEKLDLLIKLTSDNNALLSSMSPNKQPRPPPTTTMSSSDSSTSSSQRPHRTLSSATYHRSDPSSSSYPSSPSTRLDFDDVSSFLQTHFQTLSTYREASDMQEMQRLYDDLVLQLRQLFDEKAALAERNADLQERLVELTAHYQSRHDEMRMDFDSKLKTARQLAEEAKEQRSVNKALEQRLFEKERDLNARISEWDAKHIDVEAERAGLRLQLQQSENRFASLQKELMSAEDAKRDSDISLEDFKRKHKELSQSLSAKEEQLSALHRECLDLHAKLKKPFIVPARIIDSTEKRITHDHEIMRLRDELHILRESEHDLQQQYVRVQEQSQQEVRSLKEAAARDLQVMRSLGEKEAEGLRKEVLALQRQMEQHERARKIAEEQLSSATMQASMLEESIERINSENIDLSFSRDSNEVEKSGFQERLQAKKDELLRVSRELKRAREGLEEHRRVSNEKDRLVSAMKARYQSLQLAMKAHLEKDVELLVSLKGLVAHNNTHSLSLSSLGYSTADKTIGASMATMRLLDASISMSSEFAADTPGSVSFSTPISMSRTPTVDRDGSEVHHSGGSNPQNSSSSRSSRSKSLKLSELEAQCATLWGELFAAMDQSLMDLRAYYSRSGDLRAELEACRDEHALVKTELDLQVAKQRQEAKELRRHVEELQGRVQRLQDAETASKREIDELNTALMTSKDDLSARTALIGDLQSSIAELQHQLSAAQSNQSDLSMALHKAEHDCATSRREMEALTKRSKRENLAMGEEAQALSLANTDLKARLDALKLQLSATMKELEQKDDRIAALSMEGRSRMQELQSTARQEVESTHIEFQVAAKKLGTTQVLLEDTLRQLQLSKQELVAAGIEKDSLTREIEFREKQLSSCKRELDACVKELETSRAEGGSLSIQLQQTRLELLAARSEKTDVSMEVQTKHAESMALARQLQGARSECMARCDELEAVRAELADAKSARDEATRAVELQMLRGGQLRVELDASHQEKASVIARLEEARREAQFIEKQLDACQLELSSVKQELASTRQELVSMKSQLNVAKEQSGAAHRDKASLQEQCSQAEKAQLQIIAAIQLDIESLPQVVDSKSSGNKALLSPATATSHPSKGSSEDKVHQLLVDTAAQLKTKNRDLHKFFKARKHADIKHMDALTEWLDSMNASVVKGLQTPSSSTATSSTAVGGLISAANRLSFKHLHNNIVMSSDNTALMAKLTAFEESASQLMQRVRTKGDDTRAMEAKLAASKARIEQLENLASDLQPAVVETQSQLMEAQSQLIEAQHRNELLVLQEEALIRNRDRLEDDLSALDDKYRVAMMHRDELEHSLCVVEDDLTHTKQELIDARIAIDEVFLDLQTCRNELSSSQQAHAAVLVEKEALENELFTAQKEKDHCHEEIKQMKDWREARELQVEELRKEHELQLTSYQSKCIELESNCVQLMTTRSQLDERLTDALNENTRLSAKLDESAVRWNDLQRAHTEVTLQLYKAQSSEREALSTIAEMRTQLSERDGMVSSHDERIAAMQSEAREHIAEITSLRPLVAKLKRSEDEVKGCREAHAELQHRYDQSSMQLDEARRSCEQLTKSQSDSDALIADLRSMLTTLGDEHNDLLTKSTHLKQQLTSYTHLDSDYQSIRLELTAKTAEVQLLKGQLDAGRQSTQQLRSGLDVTTRKSQLQEEQLELTTRKLESLTDEYKKRIDEHALLKAEQATQQQQLMGALTLQLDDTRHKRDLSESSLRVLDEQLKSKTAELEGVERAMEELSREKASVDQQLLLAINDKQHLEASLKELRSMVDAKEQSLKDISGRLDTASVQLVHHEHTLSSLQDKLTSKEEAMAELQLRCDAMAMDLADKGRLLEEVSTTAGQVMAQLQRSERALAAAMAQSYSLQEELTSKLSEVATHQQSLQTLREEKVALELRCESQERVISESKQSAVIAIERIRQLEADLHVAEHKHEKAMQKHQETEAVLMEVRGRCRELQSSVELKEEEVERLQHQCHRMELGATEAGDSLRTTQAMAAKMRVEIDSNHSLQLETTRAMEESRLHGLAVERELMAAREEAAANEAALAACKQRCDVLKTALSEKERACEEAVLSIHELQLKAQQLANHDQLQSTSLQSYATDRHRLDEQMEALKSELSRAALSLNEATTACKETELELAESMHKESVARMQLQLLQQDRDNLFDGLQEATSALARTKIELTEATSRLQTKAAIESELLAEKQSRQLQLEEALKECNYLRSTGYEEAHVVAKQRGAIRELREANTELGDRVMVLKAEKEALEKELRACMADLVVHADSQVVVDQLRASQHRLRRAEDNLEAMRKKLDSCELQREAALKDKELVSRQLQSSMASLDQTHHSLHSDALHSKGEATRLALDLQACMRDLSEAAAQNDSQREKNQALSGRLAAKVEEAEALSRQVDELTRWKESAAMSTQSHLMELHALRKQVDRSNAKLSTQQKELDDLLLHHHHHHPSSSSSSLTVMRELSEVRAQLMTATTQEQQRRASLEQLQHEHKLLQREMADMRAENDRLSHRLKNAQMDMDFAQRQFSLASPSSMSMPMMSMYGHHGRPMGYDSPGQVPSSDRLSSAIEGIGSILRDKSAGMGVTPPPAVALTMQQKELELVNANQKCLDLTREKDALEGKSRRQERKIEKMRSRLEQTEEMSLQLHALQQEVAVLTMEMDKCTSELKLKDNELRSTVDQLQQVQARSIQDLNASLQKQSQLESDLRRAQQDADESKHAIAAAERSHQLELMALRKELDFALKDATGRWEVALEQCKQMQRDGDVLRREKVDLEGSLAQCKAEILRSCEVERALSTDNDRLQASMTTLQSSLSTLTEEYNHKYLQHSNAMKGLMDQLHEEKQQVSNLQLRHQELCARTSAMVDRFVVAVQLTDEEDLHLRHRPSKPPTNDDLDLLDNLSGLFLVLETKHRRHAALELELSEVQRKLVVMEGKHQSLVASHNQLDENVAVLIADNTRLKREAGSAKDLLAMQESDFRDKTSMLGNELVNKVSLKEAEWKAVLASEESKHRLEMQRSLTEHQSTVDDYRRQVAQLQAQTEELSSHLSSLKTSNDELEYMCDTMVAELKQTVEHDVQLQTLKESHGREVDELKQKARDELEATVGPMRSRIDELTKRVDELNTRLQVDNTYEATVGQQLLQINQLVKTERQLRLEVSVLQDTLAAMPSQKDVDDRQKACDRAVRELQSLDELVAAVHDKVMVAYVSSPQKLDHSPVSLSLLSVTSHSSSVDKLSSLERAFKESIAAVYELHINYSCQIDVVKVKNELISDLKQRLQQLTLSSETHLNTIADDLGKLSMSLHIPRSAPSSSSSPSHSYLDLSKEDSSFQQVKQTIERLGQDFDRTIAKHKTECHRLTSECASLRREVEGLRDQLQLEERNDAIKAQLAATLHQNRVLQESLSQGQMDTEHKERVLQQLVDQTSSVQQSWQRMEKEYQSKIDDLRDQLRTLKAYRDDTQQKVREFDQLLGTAFYNSPTTPPLVDDSASPATRGGEIHRSTGSTSGTRYRSKSTALRTPPSADRTKKFRPPAGTLGEVLQDVHRVLKDHRRLKRLCSSQQLCILSLRLLARQQS